MKYFDINTLFILNKAIMEALINGKKYIFDALIGIFPENVIKKMIVKMISEYDIDNFIGDETIKYILNNPKITFSWFSFSCNSKITMDIVEKYIDTIPWDFCGLSDNPNLTIEFIAKHLDKNWRWDYVSYNPNITMDIIEKYINLIPWNWTYVSENPNLTMEFVEKYIDKEWNFNTISSNLMLSMEETNKMLVAHGKDTSNVACNSSLGGLLERILSVSSNVPFDWHYITNMQLIEDFMNDKYAEIMNELEKFRIDEEIF